MCHESDNGQPERSGKMTVSVPLFAPQTSCGLAEDRKRSPRLEVRDKPPQPCKDCGHYMKSTSYIRNQIALPIMYNTLAVELSGNAVQQNSDSLL